MVEKVALTAHQQKWLERLEACEASGQGYSEFAVEQGYKIRSLYDAKKVLVKKGVLPRTHNKSRTHSSRFQRVQTAPEAVSGEWRIQLPNGVAVMMSGSFDAAVLSTVLTTAARVE